jgi:hypothetical protein
VTAEVVGLHGDAAVVVALRGGVHVLEEGEPGSQLAVALRAVRLDPPYRARLQRRHGDVWAIAARTLQLIELEPDPGGDEILVEWDGRERSVHVDGVARLVPLPELGPVRGGRVAPYAGVLRRLHRTTWEIEISEI